jgi:phosphoglucosamine mutase
MINVRVEQTPDLAAHPEIAEAVAEVEKILGDRGRVLLRPSGTEPVVRVMIEGEDADEVGQLCERLADRVGKILA